MKKSETLFQLCVFTKIRSVCCYIFIINFPITKKEAPRAFFCLQFNALLSAAKVVARRPFPSFNRAHCRRFKVLPFFSPLTSNLQTRKRGPRADFFPDKMKKKYQWWALTFTDTLTTATSSVQAKRKAYGCLSYRSFPLLLSPQTLSSVNQWSLSSSQFNLSQWWLQLFGALWFHFLRALSARKLLLACTCTPHNVLDF